MRDFYWFGLLYLRFNIILSLIKVCGLYYITFTFASIILMKLINDFS